MTSSQFSGGILGEKFGAKWLIGTGTFLAGVLTLFNPLAARSGGIGALIALRVVQGLVQVGSYATLLHSREWGMFKSALSDNIFAFATF